jgi:hypothetical protein
LLLKIHFTFVTLTAKSITKLAGMTLGSLAEELDWFPARDSIYRQSKRAQSTAVLPSASQETNKFILARTMYGEVPRAFVVLALLLTDERSNSAEPSNMLGVWIPIGTRCESFWEDPSNMLGPFHPYRWMIFVMRGTHVPQVRVGFITH